MINHYLAIDTENCTLADLFEVMTRRSNQHTILNGEFVEIDGVRRESGSGKDFIITWTNVKDGKFSAGSTYCRVK
jgi:hypothetical protein